MADLALRSILFVPGTRPDRFPKAFASGADAVVLDLEDAVEHSRKAEARRTVAEFLASRRLDAKRAAATFVRVNAPDSRAIDDDLPWARTIAGSIDAIVVPKVESALSLETIAEVAPDRHVIPLLETPRGILDAPTILAAKAGIPAVLFGAEDLTASLGVPRTLEAVELLYARSRIVLAAATIGAEPIDAVWVNLNDPGGLARDAEQARALGFRGKLAVHPDQIATINAAFSPTALDIAEAQRIVDADDRARASGDGAFRLNDQMVDAPVVARARRVLARAARLKS